MSNKSSFNSALNRKVIPGLDAVRATAISLVVTAHFFLLPDSSGRVGVIIFFVLSGFLITQILLREFARDGDISLKKFYGRRALRIFPVMYVCWGVEALLLIAHHEKGGWWELWAAFFYVMNYARAIAGSTNVHHLRVLWSLAIEEQFYLVWPAALLWILRRRGNAIRAVTLAILAVWTYRALMFLCGQVSWSYIYNSFETRIDALMVGALVALAAPNRSFEKLIHLPLKSPWVGALTTLALAASVGFGAQLERHPASDLLVFSLQPLLAAVLLLQAVHFGASSWGVLGHPILRFLARISYSLYLLHALVLEEGTRLTLRGHTGTLFGVRLLDAQGHPRLLILLIPALILPVISYYFVELPFMRLRDRKPSELHEIQENGTLGQEGWMPAPSIAVVNET